jgi:hypothetical protein
MEMWQMS